MQIMLIHKIRRARRRHQGPGSPLHSGVTGGWHWAAELGAGGGCGFRGMAAAAIVLGKIGPHHRWPDARSRGLWPVLFRGMARQPPAPCGRDGRAVITGLPPQACCCSCGQRDHLAKQWHVAGGRLVTPTTSRGWWTLQVGCGVWVGRIRHLCIRCQLKKAWRSTFGTVLQSEQF